MTNEPAASADAGRRVHEVFLNADRRARHPGASEAEDVFITKLHEACHVYAKANGIADTSNGGYYHNARFREIAIKIGLATERVPGVGYTTPSLLPWARAEYADLLAELERGLVLSREPHLVERAVTSTDAGDEPQPSTDLDTDSQSTDKYVFASCRCRTDRNRPVTIRVAAGSWKPGVIRCGECGTAFTESLKPRRRRSQGRCS